MNRRLRDFFGKHAGQTAYVFGKGPSLARFQMEVAGPLRCAINDAVRYVPDCVYCFANDSVRAWADLYRPEHVLFSPSRTLRNAALEPAFPACEIVEFLDDCNRDRLLRGLRAVIDDGPVGMHGTICSAAQILAAMGVKKIVAVGCDGGAQHAQLEFRTKPPAAGEYDEINRQFRWVAECVGLELEFFK